MSEFLIVGNATVDLFVSGLERLPALGGDEFTVDNLAFCQEPLAMVVGGNACICAYALARLGAPVALAGAIGRDRLGDFVAGWLDQAGVKTAGLKQSEAAATSTTVVVTDRRLNRLSFHHPGATDDYLVDDLPAALAQGAGVMLLATYTLLPRWRPDGFERALQQARQQGTVTALDIGPAIGRPAEFGELAGLLPYVDYFLGNQHELAVCTGADDLAAGIARVLAGGAACVVVKRGRHGAAVCSAGGDIQHIPGFAVDARFTVGAGDSFNAGLLFALHRGLALAEAVRFANAVAAAVVSAAQGALGAPTLAQVEAFLATSNRLRHS